MFQATVTLDLREDIQHGREPFGKIMGAVARLETGQNLRLIVPFEPVPLYGVMARRGFSHTSKLTKTGDWEVVFSQDTPGVASGPETSGKLECGHGMLVEVDARGLEPPQPLVTILEALARLPRGVEMRARTDRRPLHLYSHLEERGFIAETEEQQDGSFVTTIRRQ